MCVPSAEIWAEIVWQHLYRVLNSIFSYSWNDSMLSFPLFFASRISYLHLYNLLLIRHNLIPFPISSYEKNISHEKLPLVWRGLKQILKYWIIKADLIWSCNILRQLRTKLTTFDQVIIMALLQTKAFPKEKKIKVYNSFLT